MASDSSEPTRRKHNRSSSTDDAEERSKRHKHRHRHRHRHHHHRHRSGKDKEEKAEIQAEESKAQIIDVEEKKLENIGDEDGGALGEVLVSGGSGFAGVDYEMEEGEIVEDGGLVDSVNEDSGKSKKNLHSDVESGEIATNRCDHINMGIDEVDAERLDKKSRRLLNYSVDGKQSGETDEGVLTYPERFVNGVPQDSNKVDSRPFDGDHERNSRFEEVEQTKLKKSSSSEKRNRAVSPSHSQDKYLKESSYGKLSKSPEWTRGRSRSRSIVRGTSVEDHYYADKRHQNVSDDERVNEHSRNSRRSRKDDVIEKERGHSSSRYLEGRERHFSIDIKDAHREGSRERERERTKDERERERSKLRDRDRAEREQELKERVRQRDGEREMDNEREREREMERERWRERERERGREKERERDSEKDRIREEKSKTRDRDRERDSHGGRARSKDKDRYHENDRLSRRQKYGKNGDGQRDRDDDSARRRYYQDDHNDKPARGDNLENLNPKDNQNKKGNHNLERDDAGQEDYQEKIVMQLAEQEEDEFEKIKEESRRRKQAILEKYKNQQKNVLESNNTVEDQVREASSQVASVEVILEKPNNRLESSDIYVPETHFSVGKSPLQNGLSAVPSGTGGLGEGSPKSEGLDDMFCDDIFGESPAGGRKAGKGDGVAVEKSGLNDNWDDAEGYYGYRFGEVLDGRYEIIAAHGKGVFSTVVRAKDLKPKPGDPEEVAIKIIRNNETMYKAGMEELVILKKLVGTDPENKRHCVRFLSTFKYRNHLCLVFESLHMNLREILKKFGRNIGLKLTAVRAYAKQLFIALKHLKNCGVLHCDIKPDNMLVNEAKNVLKLCDFGNAMFAGKNEITPYLVSRFYRAPEIILGLPYDHPLDIWSVGCCLFELYTGKVLFPGATNNDMLRLQMELKGPFPKKMLRKGAFTDQHFDQDLNFLATEEDPVSKKTIRRLIVNIKPKDFSSLILASTGEDPKMVANFKDLMEKIFILDPDKRLTVSQALSHPFNTGK